eukprot:c14489_g1_i1 orf=871-2745(-)
MDSPTRAVLVKASLCLGFLFGLLQWRAKMGLRARYEAMQSHSTAQQRKRQRFLLPKSGLLSLCSPVGLIGLTSDGGGSTIEENFYKEKESLTRSSSALHKTSLFSKVPPSKFKFAQNEAVSYDPIRLAHPGSHPHDVLPSWRDAEGSYPDDDCLDKSGWHLVSRRHSSKIKLPIMLGAEHALVSLPQPRVPLPHVAEAEADTLVSLNKFTTPAASADVVSSIPEQHVSVAATDALVPPYESSTDAIVAHALVSLHEPCESSTDAMVAHALVSLHEPCVHRETMSATTTAPYQPPQTLSSVVRTGSAAATAPPLQSLPSSNHGEEVPKPEPVYKQALQKLVSRDNHLKELQAKIETEKALLETLKRTKQKLFALKKRDIVGKEDVTMSAAFTPLSQEEEEEVHQALCGANRNEVLVQHEPSNIDLSRAALQCLKPGAWLNDEVINLYMELLKERECREQKDYLKCHFFNTFFFNKLYKDTRSYNFKAVRRWTTQRKLGYSLLECDKIFVPIHKEIHWCLAVINVRERKIQYLDSLKGEDENALQVLAKYIEDEAKDKGTENVDTSLWDLDCPKDIPEQMNGCDCGMFMVKYADFLSRGNELKFTQEHMGYFRKRTVLELLQLKAR